MTNTGNKKPQTSWGLEFNWLKQPGLISTSERTQEVEQVNKDIKDAQIERYRGHDVVTLAAINNAASVEQDETRHQQDNSG